MPGQFQNLHRTKKRYQNKDYGGVLRILLCQSLFSAPHPLMLGNPTLSDLDLENIAELDFKHHYNLLYNDENLFNDLNLKGALV